MPNIVQSDEAQAERQIRDAAQGETAERGEVRKPPEIEGLPVDIDDINILELKTKTVENLKEWMGTFEEADASQIQNTIIDRLESHINAFSDEHSSPETRQQTAEKFREIADKYGEDIGELILAEYKHEFVQLTTLINSIVDDRNLENKGKVLVLMATVAGTSTSESASVHYRGLDTNSPSAAQLANEYGGPENSEKLTRMLNVLADQPRYPYFQHGDSITQMFPIEADSTAEEKQKARAGISEYLLQEERTRAWRFRTALGALNEVVPIEEREITHEKPFAIKQEDYTQYHKLLDQAAEGTLDEKKSARNTKGTLKNPRLFGLITKQQKRTGHEKYSMKEFGVVTNRKGESVSFNMQVERGVIYEYVRRGEQKGTLVEGQTSWNERDFDIVATPRHAWRLDNLVKAEDMVDMLTNHVKFDGELVHTLQVRKDGEVKVLSLTRREYDDMLTSAKTAVSNFISTFEKLDVDIDALREQQKHEQYIEEKEARANSWIEHQLAYEGINNVAEALIARGIPAETVAQIHQANSFFTEMFVETQTYYGSSSKYELLARQNLYARNISEENPNWENELKDEVNRISIEWAQRDHILTELSYDVQSRFNDLRQLSEMNVGSAEITRITNELTELLRNIDYNFEMRLMARMSMLITAEGDMEFDNYADALESVRNRFLPLLRTDVRTPNTDALRERRMQAAGEISQGTGELMEYAENIDRHLRPYARILTEQAAELNTISQNFIEEINNIRETGQTLMQRSEDSPEEQALHTALNGVLVAVETSMRAGEVTKEVEEALDVLNSAGVRFSNQTIREQIQFLRTSGWVEALVRQKAKVDGTLEEAPNLSNEVMGDFLDRVREIGPTTEPADEADLIGLSFGGIDYYLGEYREAVNQIATNLNDEANHITEMTAYDREQAGLRAVQISADIERAIREDELERIRQDWFENTRAPISMEEMNTRMEELNTWVEETHNPDTNPIEFAQIAITTSRNTIE